MDILLGGFFLVYKFIVNDDLCVLIFKEGVVLIEVMVYVVKYVNKNRLFFYDIFLGYDICDICNKVLVVLKIFLDFVNGRKVLSEWDWNFIVGNVMKLVVVSK